MVKLPFFPHVSAPELYEALQRARLLQSFYVSGHFGAEFYRIYWKWISNTLAHQWGGIASVTGSSETRPKLAIARSHTLLNITSQSQRKYMSLYGSVHCYTFWAESLCTDCKTYSTVQQKRTPIVTADVMLITMQSWGDVGSSFTCPPPSEKLHDGRSYIDSFVISLRAAPAADLVDKRGSSLGESRRQIADDRQDGTPQN